jgi:hypothetical protein
MKRSLRVSKSWTGKSGRLSSSCQSSTNHWMCEHGQGTLLYESKHFITGKMEWNMSSLGDFGIYIHSLFKCIRALKENHCILKITSYENLVKENILYPFICWWAPRLFPSLAYVNTAAMNMDVQVSRLCADLHSFRYMSKSGVARSYTVIYINT